MLQLETIEEVAVRVRFSPVTITHWAYGRRPAPAKFPQPIKVGRQVRYIASQIDEWILDQCDGVVASRHSGAPRRDLPYGDVGDMANDVSGPRKRGRPRKTGRVEGLA